MKKSIAVIFIAACLSVCLIPSAGMLIKPTTRSTENRSMAPAPALKLEDGSFNTEVSSEFDAYFSEHMALRNPLVAADGMIQSNLFATSNVDGVIRGTDGWLYYSSTLDDYLGTKLMTEGEIFALAHNFKLIEDYCRERNVPFCLILPPNKNTLYGAHMPYYKDKIVNEAHNLDALTGALQAQGVTYVDILSLFRETDETLYLKRDSHWNGKGAAMAYDAIMDALAVDHEDPLSRSPQTVQVNGDLNKMIYSFYGPTEDDENYAPASRFTYTEGGDVEDGRIVTENGEGSGTLLMFRDSFANTLIPFTSDAFAAAAYSKGEPNAMERFFEDFDPDYAVIEKVERNIRDYLENPPILTPPSVPEPQKLTILSSSTTAIIENCANDVGYLAVRGTADERYMTGNAAVFVRVDGKYYAAFLTGEKDFLLYLKKEAFTADSAEVAVFVENADGVTQVFCENVPLPQ